jgi:hypothetical protein
MPTSRPYVGGDGNLYQRSLTDASAGTTSSPDVAFFALESSVDLGVKNDSVATTDTGNFSLIALVKRALQGLTFLTLTFTRPTIITVTGTVSSSEDTTIVSAPGAGLSIYITHLLLQNESLAATTILLKDSNIRLRCLTQSQGDGLAWTFPERRELKLATNTPLILNLSTNNSCGYSIAYYISS